MYIVFTIFRVATSSRHYAKWECKQLNTVSIDMKLGCLSPRSVVDKSAIRHLSRDLFQISCNIDIKIVTHQLRVVCRCDGVVVIPTPWPQSG